MMYLLGVEGATGINREIKAALGDFLPGNNDGIFYIKEREVRGPAIEELAEVLERYHGPGCTMLSGSSILELWLNNAIVRVLDLRHTY